MSVSKIEKITEEKEKQGIVAFAGRVDGRGGELGLSKGVKVYKIGSITYYIDEYEYQGNIIGWESTELINHIDLPSIPNLGYMQIAIKKDCLKGTEIESITLQRNRKDLRLSQDYQNVKKVIIPKEAKKVKIHRILSFDTLGDIREIEFEAPCGWGIKKDIIADPKKTYEYILEQGKNSKYDIVLEKTLSNRISYFLGL